MFRSIITYTEFISPLKALQFKAFNVVRRQNIFHSIFNEPGRMLSSKYTSLNTQHRHNSKYVRCVWSTFSCSWIKLENWESFLDLIVILLPVSCLCAFLMSRSWFYPLKIFSRTKFFTLWRLYSNTHSLTCSIVLWCVDWIVKAEIFSSACNQQKKEERILGRRERDDDKNINVLSIVVSVCMISVAINADDESGVQEASRAYYWQERHKNASSNQFWWFWWAQHW